MRVAVLGCGPAGLMAAQGVDDAQVDGIEIAIFSRKQKSSLYGAQYLHRPIPGFTTKDNFIDIDYQIIGDAGMYRAKVYGDSWPGTVSPQELGSRHAASDIRETYDRLWEKWEPYIHHIDNITPGWLTYLAESFKPDLVISSVPRDMMCIWGHHFGFATIVAAGDAPDLGIDVGRMYPCPEGTVVCSGEPDVSWYRKSRIFGHTTVEWPANIRPPINSAAIVRKPTHHQCDCWGGVVWVGRYGKWAKGVLSHTAYDDAIEAVEKAAAL